LVNPERSRRSTIGQPRYFCGGVFSVLRRKSGNAALANMAGYESVR
jgi:hypothetical protein